MATYGPLFPATTGNDSSNGASFSWANTGSISANDTTYASTATAGGLTQYLKASNFGFSIPSDQIVNGIEVTIRRSCSGTTTDNTIKLLKAGTIGGDNLSTGATWSSSLTDDTFGGGSETWGRLWSYADINDSSFGVVMSCVGDLPSSLVDSISITVYTHEAGGGGGDGIYWVDAFLTFRNQAIPKNVTIQNAFMRFYPLNDNPTDIASNEAEFVNAMIFGQDIDSGTAPLNATDANTSDKTTNCVSWDTIDQWAAGTYDSPDIACIIQEIVDREGWEPGNDITLYLEDNYSSEVGGSFIGRIAYDYGVDPDNASELFVYYTIDEVGSGGVVCGGRALIEDFIVARGGVVCGGSKLANVIYSPTHSGGVVVGGRANDYKQYNETSIGGVVVSGLSKLGGSTSVIASGGVVVNKPDYPNGFGNRRTITIFAHKVLSDQVGYPWNAVLNTGPNNNITRAAGSDLAGNPLPTQLISYHAESGNTAISTKVDISLTEDTKYYVYF